MREAVFGDVKMKFLTQSLFAFATLGFAAVTQAQAPSTGSGQAYPTKPVRFIVPQATGGASDVLSRIIALKLSEQWPYQVVVDNRVGAGGNIGTEMTARAAPDGYTWVLGFPGTHAINPVLYKNLTWDPIKNFEPVANLAVVPYVVVAGNNLPAKNMQELIALAKAKPGDIKFGSAGNGTINHLLGPMIATAGGFKLTHIPYRGIAIAVTNIIANEVQLAFGSVPSVIGQIRGGLIKPLAVTTLKRLDSMKDVPTMNESGFPGFEVTPWFGILTTGGSPAPVVQKINADINKLLVQKDVAERFAAQGADPAPWSPEQFAKVLRADMVKWAKVVKDSGATLD
jgi:tripartite-type tricarboxylate transporter receptor subunit TctC